MARDSILDEAEKKRTDDQQPDADAQEDDAGEGDEEVERERLTQRTPPDLLDDVDRVQEKFHLPSRNATINFMLNAAADELLED
ncbi:MAG: hypothetical protein ACOCZD_00630 [Haloferacaceae archaeon]